MTHKERRNVVVNKVLVPQSDLLDAAIVTTETRTPLLDSIVAKASKPRRKPKVNTAPPKIELPRGCIF